MYVGTVPGHVPGGECYGCAASSTAAAVIDPPAVNPPAVAPTQPAPGYPNSVTVIIDPDTTVVTTLIQTGTRTVILSAGCPGGGYGCVGGGGGGGGDPGAGAATTVPGGGVTTKTNGVGDGYPYDTSHISVSSVVGGGSGGAGQVTSQVTGGGAGYPYTTKPSVVTAGAVIGKEGAGRGGMVIVVWMGVMVWWWGM